MIILDKTVISPTEPPWTTVLWIKPVKGGVAYYAYLDGKWQILRPMNDKGSLSPDDDEPYDLDGVGATRLEDLEDVSLNTLSNGQILKYDGSIWENQDDNSGTPGPDTVGTEQIIDDSVMEEDLNPTVRDKIQKIYHQNEESLHMDYDIASINSLNNGGSREFNEPIKIEEGK